MPALRLVFMGSDPIALPLLDWLAGEGAGCAQVVAVFTQPDRPVGRGQKVTANGIKLWAQAKGIPVHQPDRITEVVRLELAACAADLALVMAYGHILRDDVIATPRLGTFNLHTSLLPAYRGASPIQTAVASGERETGVTYMRIVRQLDAGPSLDAERVAIAPTDTALEVEAKLSAACIPLVGRGAPADRGRDRDRAFPGCEPGHVLPAAGEGGRWVGFHGARRGARGADQRNVPVAGLQR